MREWVFRLAGRLNCAPHTLQRYGLSPAMAKVDVSYRFWKEKKKKTEGKDILQPHLSRRSWFLECYQNNSRAHSSSHAWLHVQRLGNWCRVRLGKQTVWMKQTIQRKHVFKSQIWTIWGRRGSYLFPPCEVEAAMGDPERGVAPGEGLGQNPRSRRPAPVWRRSVYGYMFYFFPLSCHLCHVFFTSFEVYLSIWPGTSPDHASAGAVGVEPILSAVGDVWLCGSSTSSSFTVVAAQRGLRTMYLYFFQLHAFGSGLGLTSLWRNETKTT